MNRRKFLKRITAIVTGAVIVPAILISKKNIHSVAGTRYWWIRECGHFPNPKLKKGPAFLYSVSKLPEFKVGSQFIVLNDSKTQGVFEYIMSGQDCNYDPEKYVLGEL